MNDSLADNEARLQHLLQVVAQNRDEQCAALRNEARTQARQVVRQAWGDARTRLHQKVLATRAQVRQQLSAAEARNQTRLRLQRHEADRTLLARAREPLGERLRQRWQHDASRRQWIDSLVEQAAGALLGSDWRVEHPADWPEPERAGLAQRLAGELNRIAVFEADPGIAAGLRICAGPACIDGTVEGLLRARPRIEALILATLNECRSLLALDAPGHSDD